MNKHNATTAGALRLTAAVLLSAALLQNASAAAAAKKIAAGELLLRIPVPAALAAQIGGLSGTELLEMVAGRGNEGPTARLVPAQQLPVGSACLLTGIVRAVNTAAGTMELGDYTVDYTPLLHDTAFAAPATGSAGPTLTGITGSAGPVLMGITGSARKGITGSAGPTLTGITGSARSGT